MITDYCIVSEYYIEHLVELVNKKIEEGYTPLGGAFSYRSPDGRTASPIGQAMVKVTKE